MNLRKQYNNLPIKQYAFGFTLIELLVVISIISILAAIITASFSGIRQRGRDGQRKSDLRQIQSALELYRADVGQYPATGSGDGLLPATVCGGTFRNPNYATNSIQYMKTLPCDPMNPTLVYTYTPTCSGTPAVCTAYKLTACLENGNDQDGSSDTSTCPSSPSKVFTLNNP